MVAEMRAVARQNRNTLAVGQRGIVWVEFRSARNRPLIDLRCELWSGDRSWAEARTTEDGRVRWDAIPLWECTIVATLGSRTLEIPAPWLRSESAVHIERLDQAETEQLMGTGGCVFANQTRLRGLGYDCGDVDGILGPKTRQAAELFQADRGLVVDGVVGPITEATLIRAFDGAVPQFSQAEIVEPREPSQDPAWM